MCFGFILFVINKYVVRVALRLAPGLVPGLTAEQRPALTVFPQPYLVLHRRSCDKLLTFTAAVVAAINVVGAASADVVAVALVWIRVWSAGNVRSTRCGTCVGVALGVLT